MWIIMYLCYLLMAGSFLMMLMTGLQGYIHFSFMGANHPELALLSILIFMFTETLILFFFIAMGKTVRNYIQPCDSTSAVYDRMNRGKMKLFLNIVITMLLMGTVFILGGAVDNELLPGWVHGFIFIAGFFHFTWALIIQHRSFKNYTAVILEMFELQDNAGLPAQTEF